MTHIKTVKLGLNINFVLIEVVIGDQIQKAIQEGGCEFMVYLHPTDDTHRIPVMKRNDPCSDSDDIGAVCYIVTFGMEKTSNFLPDYSNRGSVDRAQQECGANCVAKLFLHDLSL